MRTILTLFGVAALALLSVAPASADVLTLTQSGTNWTISVTRPAGVDAIGGFDIDLRFNNAALTYTGADFGPYLGDPLLLEALTFPPDDTTAGRLFQLMEVSLRTNAELASVQPTTFDLATIHFITTGTGLPGVEISRADVSDGFGNRVIPGAEVPEPGSWLLLITTVAAIGTTLRRRCS